MGSRVDGSYLYSELEAMPVVSVDSFARGGLYRCEPFHPGEAVALMVHSCQWEAADLVHHILHSRQGASVDTGLADQIAGVLVNEPQGLHCSMV